MTSDAQRSGQRTLQLGEGQIALELTGLLGSPSEQVRNLYKLSDPALSELGLDQLLEQLLLRVRDALSVDTVAILLLDRDAQQLVARAAKGIEEEVEQGVRIPIGHGFAGRIAKERVAIFIADVDHADILNPILREKGICSLLGVPLIVEGELIGVMHVGALHPREFGQKDLAVLHMAAVRAAPAIERARLYDALEREHKLAMALQRTLLPRRIDEFPGVAVAARYLPAREEVGGDWYDVIGLARGHVGVVIGDVVGNGPAAAALMGQLRTALHAYAIEGHSPGRTLELVDRFVHSMSPSAMATAAYAVVDSDTGAVRFASAGHLPPVVVGGHEPRVLEVEPAAPLGAIGYGHCPEHEFPLAPGETLVLYTDGLIERPGVALGLGIRELVRLVREATSAEEACLLAVDRLVPLPGPRDDVAIVALENTSVPDELHLRMPALPEVLSQVRRYLGRWLRAHGADRVVTSEVTMAVSEACANAVEHAYGPGQGWFEIDARVDADLTLVVRDAGRWRAPRGVGRGRGLTIIEAAMDSVEVNTDALGTEVVMRRQLVRA